jgi:hypothetical protein
MSSTKYEFNKSITDIIKARSSVRTYENKPISAEKREKIENLIKDLKGPFGVKARLKVIDSEILKKEADIKLGTYGVIKGATSFIVTAVEKSDRNIVEVGYLLEKVILLAASLELGTCWMGGTFKRGGFSKAIELKENEIMPAVTPIGYGSGNKSFLESFMRFAAGSKNRKQWEELFHAKDFNTGLSRENAGKYAEALEMVRLGPSASNKQPWRILRENNSYHFYLQHAKGYSSAMGFDMQKLDIGIAMCHFEMTAREMEIEGMWKVINPGVKNIPEGMEYIISWGEE